MCVCVGGGHVLKLIVFVCVRVFVCVCVHFQVVRARVLGNLLIPMHLGSLSAAADSNGDDTVGEGVYLTA